MPYISRCDGYRVATAGDTSSDMHLLIGGAYRCPRDQARFGAACCGCFGFALHVVLSETETLGVDVPEDQAKGEKLLARDPLTNSYLRYLA